MARVLLLVSVVCLLVAMAADWIAGREIRSAYMVVLFFACAGAVLLFRNRS